MFEQWERTHDISPEQRLWRVVVLVLLQDIQKCYLNYINSLNGKRGKLYDEMISEYNVAKSEWMERVCEFAGIPHEKLMTVVRRIINGEQTIRLPKKFHH